MERLESRSGLGACSSMNHFMRIGFLFLFLASALVWSEEPVSVPTVTPAEAATQEGKEVKVKGRVEGQKTSAKGVTYLNFGAMDISSSDQIHVIEEPAAAAPESKPSEPAS